jgi:crossover junction endodeoxyribonuclease RuvC
LIIGLDPGSKSCGYAILDAANLIDYGMFDLDGAWPRRLHMLKENLAELIRMHRGIEYAVVETPYVGPHATAVIGVSQARGVVLSTLYSSGVTDVRDIAPSQAKLAMTGSGNASKDKMKDAVIQKFKIEPNLRYDIYDAIGIGYGYLLTHGIPIEGVKAPLPMRLVPNR